MAGWFGTVQGEVAGLFPQYAYWKPIPWDMKRLEHGDGRVLQDRPFPRWTKLDTPKVPKVQLLDWEIWFGREDRQTGFYPVELLLKAGPFTFAKWDFLAFKGSVAGGLFSREEVEEWILSQVFRAKPKKVQEGDTKRA